MNSFLFLAATSVLRVVISAGTLAIGASFVGPVRPASAQATGVTEQHQHHKPAKPTATQPEDHSQIGKTAHDLDVASSLVHDVEGEQIFIVSKLQGGYTRYFAGATGLKAGLGVTASAGFVAEDLAAEYRCRVNPGFGIFVTIRPAAMQMPMTSTRPDDATPSGRTSPGKPAPRATATPAPAREAKLPVLPAERIIDPDCAPTIDLMKAPRAIHQGKVYHFCSERDRGEILKDPAAYIKKRGWR